MTNIVLVSQSSIHSLDNLQVQLFAHLVVIHQQHVVDDQECLGNLHLRLVFIHWLDHQLQTDI